MQKQVEVRMDENHLEPMVDPNENLCSTVCDKIMKNMVLTLTILGKFTATNPYCIVSQDALARLTVNFSMGSLRA